MASFLLDSPLLFVLFYEQLVSGSIDPVTWWLFIISRTESVGRGLTKKEGDSRSHRTYGYILKLTA